MPALPTLTLALLLAAGAGLSGCAEAQRMMNDATTMASSAGQSASMTTTTAASWTTDAREHRGQSGTFAFDCPPNGSRDSIWGSGPYTDDSGVCTAGVHAGVISYRNGGRVNIQPRPGQNRYAGSTRNGVRTNDYPSWPGSFVVVR